jgi:hypothetical protein
VRGATELLLLPLLRILSTVDWTIYGGKDERLWKDESGKADPWRRPLWEDASYAGASERLWVD